MTWEKEEFGQSLKGTKEARRRGRWEAASWGKPEKETLGNVGWREDGKAEGEREALVWSACM